VSDVDIPAKAFLAGFNARENTK